MKVKILKPFQIIGTRAYPKDAIIDVQYDETTTKRLIKSGHFAPYVRGMEGVEMEVERDPIDDDDDFVDQPDPADSRAFVAPKRATPRPNQPVPRVRRPVPAVAGGEGEDDDESHPA